MNVIWDSPEEIAKKMANRLRRIRKLRGLTQQQLANRSGISYASLRRFEKTGQASVSLLVKICMELGTINEINSLFTTPVYNSIEEVLRDGS